MNVPLYKNYCGKNVYASRVDSAKFVSTEKPLRVTARLLVGLGVFKSNKAAYNTLKFLVEKGKARKLGRGVYLLFPGSRTYEKVAKALRFQATWDSLLVRLGFAVDGGGGGLGRWWRWGVVFWACVLGGGVCVGWVCWRFGLGRKAGWALLNRLVRAGVLRRVGRGWYGLAWDVGVTRVDCCGGVVSNRGVAGRVVHHPVFGFRFLGEIPYGRKGTVQLAFSKRGKWLPEYARFVQVYSYKHNGEHWFKVEPAVHVKAPVKPEDLVWAGLRAVKALHSAIDPLAKISKVL